MTPRMDFEILTKEQVAAVTTTAKKALVKACPGSGKTEVIIQRILWLIAQGVDPIDIAVITYTNSAARVVERRLENRSDIPIVYSEHIVGQPRPEPPKYAGPINPIRLGFVGTLHAFCLRHLSNFGPWVNLRVIDEEDADALLTRCGREVAPKAKWSQLAELRSLWHAIKTRAPETPAEIAVARYYAEMVNTGEVDYETLLRWTLGDFESPDAPRRKWAYLIVDEFQDATETDARIYEAAGADNLFLVGDEMQSIFAFRGSSGVALIEAIVESPEWEKHQLTTNFRSLPAICTALNNLASHAPGGPRSPVNSFVEEGGTVTSRFFDDEHEEAEGIALAVQHQAESIGPPPPEGTEAFVGWTASMIAAASQIAVLTRYNRTADMIAGKMREMGVPVCQLKAVEQPKDWKLAMAALGLLARPRSAQALRRYNERRKSNKAAAGPLTGKANFMDEELAALGVSPESRQLIIERFGQLPTSADLRDLELNLTLEPIARRMEGEGCFVGTIHAAKGNEWDRVVLAAFEEEMIPGTRKDANIDEERRLAYVGISRARLSVTLSWAGLRRRFGDFIQAENLSRFAEEAGIR